MSWFVLGAIVGALFGALVGWIIGLAVSQEEMKNAGVWPVVCEFRENKRLAKERARAARVASSESPEGQLDSRGANVAEIDRPYAPRLAGGTMPFRRK